MRASERTTPITSYRVLYEYDVPMPNLPVQIDGMSILHLSDIHFHRNKQSRTDEFRAIVDYVNSLKEPIDIIIITGDIITDNARDLSVGALKALKELRLESQRFFLLGNHDFYESASSEVREALGYCGYADLTNHHLRVSINGAAINFFGVDDFLDGEPNIPYSAETFSHEPSILLTQNLDVVQRAYPDAFDLILSGHLHSGETSLFGIDGTYLMELFGYTETVNSQRNGWDSLTDRAISFISPGQARHYFQLNTDKPGVVLHRLKRQ